MLDLQVKGMSCGHCANAVTQALKEIDPKAEVMIDLPTGKVQVETSAGDQAVREAITEAGYEVVA